jgi:hypothetical protein
MDTISNLQILRSAISRFQTEHGRLPGELGEACTGQAQAFCDNFRVGDQFLDGWGSALSYVASGEEYELRSAWTDRRRECA